MRRPVLLALALTAGCASVSVQSEPSAPQRSAEQLADAGQHAEAGARRDDEAAKANPFFPGRVAHGYLLLSFAAGLFVDPAPGPVGG